MSAIEVAMRTPLRRQAHHSLAGWQYHAPPVLAGKKARIDHFAGFLKSATSDALKKTALGAGSSYSPVLSHTAAACRSAEKTLRPEPLYGVCSEGLDP